MKVSSKVLVVLLLLIPLAIGISGQPLPMDATYHDALSSLRSFSINRNSAEETAALATVLEFSPWRGELWQRMGRLYQDSNQLVEAESAYTKAENLHELDDQGNLWLAELMIEQGREQEASLRLENIESKDPVILAQAAALLRKTNSLEASVNLLLKAIALDPDNEILNFELGVLKMASQPAEALEHLNRVRSNEDLVAKARFLAETIEIYQTDWLESRWYIQVGQTLSQVEEWDAAVDSFVLGTEADPKDAVSWALLAEAQQQIGEDGISSLETALKLDPFGELVNGITGIYYRRQGETEKALVYLKKALDANSKAAVWQIEIAGALADAGSLEEALAAHWSAIDMDETNLKAWEALARFSLKRNFRVRDQGLPAARRLVLLEPRNPVYLDLLGTAYLTLADLDSAEKFFLQALEYDPEEAAILIHLGQTSLFRGDIGSGSAPAARFVLNHRREAARFSRRLTTGVQQQVRSKNGIISSNHWIPVL